MTELNKKVKNQIDEILKTARGTAAHTDSAFRWNAQATANGLILRIRRFAPCFKLYLYDALCREINSVYRVIPCRWDIAADNTCQRGLDTSRCDGCNTYVPEDSKLTDQLDCTHCPFNTEQNGDC